MTDRFQALRDALERLDAAIRMPVGDTKLRRVAEAEVIYRGAVTRPLVRALLAERDALAAEHEVDTRNAQYAIETLREADQRFAALEAERKHLPLAAASWHEGAETDGADYSHNVNALLGLIARIDTALSEPAADQSEGKEA